MKDSLSAFGLDPRDVFELELDGVASRFGRGAEAKYQRARIDVPNGEDFLLVGDSVLEPRDFAKAILERLSRSAVLPSVSTIEVFARDCVPGPCDKTIPTYVVRAGRDPANYSGHEICLNLLRDNIPALSGFDLTTGNVRPLFEITQGDYSALVLRLG